MAIRFRDALGLGQDNPPTGPDNPIWDLLEQYGLIQDDNPAMPNQPFMQRWYGEGELGIPVYRSNYRRPLRDVAWDFDPLRYWERNRLGKGNDAYERDI